MSLPAAEGGGCGFDLHKKCGNETRIKGPRGGFRCQPWLRVLFAFWGDLGAICGVERLFGQPGGAGRQKADPYSRGWTYTWTNIPPGWSGGGRLGWTGEVRPEGA